jgi:hypothetical protein
MPDRVDTATAARAAKVSVGTLNVWIQRDLLPGIEVGVRGRARSFTIDDVRHIAIMAALVRAGIASPLASRAAALARTVGRWNEPHCTLVIGPSANDPRLSGAIPDIGFVTPDEIITPNISVLDGERLKPEHWTAPWGARRPEAYVVVEIWRVVERIKGFLSTLEAEAKEGGGQE